MEWRHLRRAGMEERLPQRQRANPAYVSLGDREIDVNQPAWQRVTPRARIHPPQAAPQRVINVSPAVDMRMSRRRGAILGDQRVRRRLMQLMMAEQQ